MGAETTFIPVSVLELTSWFQLNVEAPRASYSCRAVAHDIREDSVLDTPVLGQVPDVPLYQSRP